MMQVFSPLVYSEQQRPVTISIPNLSCWPCPVLHANGGAEPSEGRHVLLMAWTLGHWQHRFVRSPTLKILTGLAYEIAASGVY
jgi:hypothetical protein